MTFKHEKMRALIAFESTPIINSEVDAYLPFVVVVILFDDNWMMRRTHEKEMHIFKISSLCRVSFRNM